MNSLVWTRYWCLYVFLTTSCPGIGELLFRETPVLWHSFILVEFAEELTHINPTCTPSIGDMVIESEDFNV